MKILFGWIFNIVFQALGKSYRQVLTPVNNSQLLLYQEILDKFRIVTFHKIQYKENKMFNWFKLFRRNTSSRDLETQSIDITMLSLT